MLTNLLPGLREIRAPVVSGYLWLVFFYLLLHDDLPTRATAAPAVQPLFQLGDRLSVVGIATVASVAAYLVGSAMQEVLMLVGRLGSPRRPLYGEPGVRTTATGRDRLTQSVTLRVQGIAQRLFQVALSPGERNIENAPAADEVIAELPVVRTLMLGEHPELVGELDRLQAEADLRITVAVPLAALAVYFAAVSSPGWLLALVPSLLLLLQGHQRQREAGDFLARVLQIGKTDHPAVKTFELSVNAALEQTELEWNLKGEMASGDGRAAFRYGNLLFNAREYEKAIEPLTLATDQGVAEAYAQVGLSRERLGEDKKAERAYRDGSERGDRKSRERLTDFLERNKRDEEARATAKPVDADPAKAEDPSSRKSGGDQRGESARILKYEKRIEAGDAKAALNLGLLHQSLRSYDQAVAAFTKATELDRNDPQGWRQLGLLLHDRRQSDDALSAFEFALAIQQRELGPDHLEVAGTLANLGNVALTLGQAQRSRELLERALAIQEKELGHDSIDIARNKVNLGNALRRLGRYEEARDMVQQALDVEERKLSPDSTSIAITLVNLGRCLTALGEFDRARVLQERAIAIEERAFGDKNIEVARSRSYLATTLRGLGAFERALDLQRQSLEVQEGELGGDHVDIGWLLDEIGGTQLELGMAEESEATRRKALAVAAAAADPEIGAIRRGLGETLHSLGRDDEALTMVEEAIVEQGQSLPPDHPELARSYDLVADILESRSSFVEATVARKRAAEIRDTGSGDR